jgi:hypothetical protein
MGNLEAPADLPPRVYLKHGRYWHVHRRKWKALPRALNEAIAIAKDLNTEIEHGGTLELRCRLERTYINRRNAAKARGIVFTISFDEVLQLARVIKHSLYEPTGKKRAPFAPSIDRIDGALGYAPGNVRVVCFAANCAMNEWGESVLDIITEGRHRRKF